MDRKKTVLIAVLVNAGVLCVLLVAALTMQEEVLPSAPLLSQSAPVLPHLEERPLFNEISLPQQQEVALVLAPIEAIPSSIKDEPIVHALPAVAAVQAPSSLGAPQQTYREVAVQKGDNLEKIARAAQTTVDEIMKLNQLSSNFLKVGQVLKLPKETKEKKVAPEKPAVVADYYTVKVGDNPWTIAMKHHMKVEELLRLNGLNQEKARKLKPGDRLRVR